MKGRYIRISTATQSILRQLVKAHSDEKLFIDICSGSIPFNERPEARKLYDELAVGNIKSLSVSSVDRLGRNSFDVQSTLHQLNNYQVNVFIDNLGICSIVDQKPNPIFKIITDVLANVASMERLSLLERQREGIEAAIRKNPNTYKGRLKGTIDTDDEVLSKHRILVKIIKANPKLSLRSLSKLSVDKERGYQASPNTVKKVKNILEKSKL
ncbi:DNA invertase Pin-like site-specific DNA recombinase [Flavobacterium nitrogenifigens]|uniref:DNA invertase Pin-like site-specific DNA recombinase n=2 Tax=Flavobacterium TaxID=237 RepID=A0A7W7J2I1_9FLAO|nr:MULTISPECIES: recombinase family protein [Flavobacterium]MBB4804390.1 DNA invertase Pin-like site-specific DNA recombinase [Flavobacterium nitrogenifigens]MBB6389214.1 DNA invertase Pin-like site-specific DNA recombinase [Flavobacterium notoginsengisoli]